MKILRNFKEGREIFIMLLLTAATYGDEQF